MVAKCKRKLSGKVSEIDQTRSANVRENRFKNL